MKWEWTHNEHSRKLILIFGGWGTDASFYAHIRRDGWDTAVVTGYSDFEFPHDNLGHYDTVALFAWSLGVYAASQVFSSGDCGKIAMAVALNGTDDPVSDIHGIPEKIFDGTLSTLNERNLMKFRRRMSGTEYERLLSSFEKTTTGIDTLRDELTFIRRHSATERGESRLIWQRAYVSTGDLIFPPESQMRRWEARWQDTETVIIDRPHYVDLNLIIHAAIPSKQKIGRRFHRALPSYDAAASAQSEIAARLIASADGICGGRVAELGPGSGLLTRRFAAACRPEEMHFVDLYEMPRYDVAPLERYHVEDAEKWLEDEATRHPGSFDTIISASAIQWFANPARFFQNAATLLKPGGILLCSTFISGNLGELQKANPFGIVYHSEKEISRLLLRYFHKADTRQEDIRLTFGGKREMLRHLVSTGAGGDTSPDGCLSAPLPMSLTYRPLFIRAEQPKKP